MTNPNPFAPGSDFNMTAIVQHYRRRQQMNSAALLSTTGIFQPVWHEGMRVADNVNAGMETSGPHAPLALKLALGEILIGASLVVKGDKTDEGQLIIAVTPMFERVLQAALRDPNALYQLDSRGMEDFIAGAWEGRAGVTNVVLTPRSGDLGRDIIVTSNLFGELRILDQVKLYTPGHVVTANDVRAMYGTLTRDVGASKGIITTTSIFAPRIAEEFADQIPGRLSLRDGTALLAWLDELSRES